MRQKDAIAAENAVLSKLAEKQQRAVDSATDLQHSLGVQLVRSLLVLLTENHALTTTLHPGRC